MFEHQKDYTIRFITFRRQEAAYRTDRVTSLQSQSDHKKVLWSTKSERRKQKRCGGRAGGGPDCWNSSEDCWPREGAELLQAPSSISQRLAALPEYLKANQDSHTPFPPSHKPPPSSSSAFPPTAAWRRFIVDAVGHQIRLFPCLSPYNIHLNEKYKRIYEVNNTYETNKNVLEGLLIARNSFLYEYVCLIITKSSRIFSVANDSIMSMFSCWLFFSWKLIFVLCKD